MPRPALVAALLLFVAGPAWSGTNQLSGRAGFSNTNAEILAVLGTPGNAGLSLLNLNATSQPPAAFSTHDLAGPASSSVLASWSMDVEASAAGTVYRVIASAQLGAVAVKDDYYFLPVTSAPVFEEPAPGTDLDILECAGIARVRFVDEGGAPVTVRGDRITADSSLGGASPLAMIFGAVTEKNVIVRGDGSTWTLRAELVTGTDPFTDRMTFQRTATAVIGCDEIVEVLMTVPAPGSAQLGEITGRLDILGEDELVSAGGAQNARSRIEGNGPWRNQRVDAIPGPPSEGAWRLENLVPSDVVAPAIPWTLRAEAAFGTGHGTATFTTPSINVDVAAGASTDAGDVFVIDPVRITGSVEFAGPAMDATLHSLLQDIWRASDRDTNRDGIPDDFTRFFDSTCVTGRGRFGIATGATRSALGAVGLASVEGGFDAQGAAFRGSYRMVLGNLEGEPGFYEADELNLKLLDTLPPWLPGRYVDARVDIDDPGPIWEMAGGLSETRDRSYCLSQVTLLLDAPGGEPFHSPNATGLGSFDGVDYTGQAARYDATLWWARGLPRPPDSALTGQTTMLLPEGDWSLEPTVTIPRPTGSSVETLPEFDIEVGCRQVMEVSPGLHVLLDVAAPACVPAGLLSLSGRARGDSGIESITWSVNGAAPEFACTSCGTSATFAFDAPIGPGDNLVRVEALDAGGRRAATEIRVRSASEPSGLRVTKDASGLVLSWDAEPRDVFAVHAGSIAALRGAGYDHDLAGACDRTGSSATLPMPSGDTYLLLTSGCSAGEGSYGSDSQGSARPPSARPCG